MKKIAGAIWKLSANFHPNWAGLAVLFSRQILNNSQIFFLFYIMINSVDTKPLLLPMPLYFCHILFWLQLGWVVNCKWCCHNIFHGKNYINELKLFSVHSTSRGGISGGIGSLSGNSSSSLDPSSTNSLNSMMPVFGCSNGISLFWQKKSYIKYRAVEGLGTI